MGGPLGWTEHILDSLEESVIVINHEHRIQYMNKYAQEKYKLVNKQMEDQTLYALPVEVSLEQYKDIILELFSNGKSYQTCLLHSEDADYEQKLIEICFSSIVVENQVQYAVIMIKNIADKNILMEQYQIQLKKLMVQNEKVKEASRLKNEFLANVSHELRTPLNSIIGFSGIILDGLDGEMSPELRKDIERIHSSGKHLLSLINDILDLSKLEANRLAFLSEKVDLYEICLEAVATVETLIASKNITITMNIPSNIPYISGDQIRIKQVILNVLNNAIKFTDEGNIHIFAQAKSEKQVVEIGVKDTGIGIKEEEQDKVFEPFTQIDGSVTRKNGGTGLGMAISKQFVEQMNGQIWFTSKYDKGTTFYIQLPIYKND